tara:strand:- start:5470 stop:5859 length:390 start_codon:yes stop_codon:yes gene_type:complete
MNSQILSYVRPFKAILAIDFDGTICMSDYPALGMQRKDAGVYMRKLAKDGYGIVINTCREGIALSDAIKWLHKNAIPYHYVNCNFPHLIEMYGADCRKISADLYIDDKCLTGLPEWGDIYKIINNEYFV